MLKHVEAGDRVVFVVMIVCLLVILYNFSIDCYLPSSRNTDWNIPRTECMRKPESSSVAPPPMYWGKEYIRLKACLIRSTANILQLHITCLSTHIPTILCCAFNSHPTCERTLKKTPPVTLGKRVLEFGGAVHALH